MRRIILYLSRVTLLITNYLLVISISQMDPLNLREMWWSFTATWEAWMKMMSLVRKTLKKWRKHQNIFDNDIDFNTDLQALCLFEGNSQKPKANTNNTREVCTVSADEADQLVVFNLDPDISKTVARTVFSWMFCIFWIKIQYFRLIFND